MVKKLLLSSRFSMFLLFLHTVGKCLFLVIFALCFREQPAKTVYQSQIIGRLLFVHEVKKCMGFSNLSIRCMIFSMLTEIVMNY